jgi:aryl-alcohol dehydrogenase-like predicted oxidoreductase
MAASPDHQVPLTSLGGEITASAFGLGCLALTNGPNVDLEESAATLKMAVDQGVTLFDTADSYSAGENERFIGLHLPGNRDELTICSKFGLKLGEGKNLIDGRPEYVRQCCEASLRRLQLSHLDVLYQHRVDPLVPVEETVGAMGELVTEGKVRHLGLCEVGGSMLERASAVHRIAVVQSEWSLWARTIEVELLPAARRLQVGVVAYSPLGRGFLAGAFDNPLQLEPADKRSTDPRLMQENLDFNLGLRERLRELATEHSATMAQIALAWLLYRGRAVAIPIPGVERRDLLNENLQALSLSLTSKDIEAIEQCFPIGITAGNIDESRMRISGGAVSAVPWA